MGLSPLRHFCIFLVLLSGCANAEVATEGPCGPYVELFKGSENPSRFLAQAHQESLCNPLAVSHVGAEGLMQIMPFNFDWFQNGFCRHLGKARPKSAWWSAKCGIAYMEWFTVDLFDNYCKNKEVDEQRYNGGYHIIWELNEGSLDFDKAENICGTRLSNGRKRSKASCHENYEYPRRISKRQKQYLHLGGKYCP